MDEGIIFGTCRAGERANRWPAAFADFAECHSEPELRQTTRHQRVGKEFDPDLPAVVKAGDENRKMIGSQANPRVGKEPRRLVKEPPAFGEDGAVVADRTLAHPGAGGGDES